MWVTHKRGVFNTFTTSMGERETCTYGVRRSGDHLIEDERSLFVSEKHNKGPLKS